LTIVALFGKLKEYGLQMNMLNEQESGERKLKGIALRTSAQKRENSEDESSECNDTETLNY